MGDRNRSSLEILFLQGLLLALGNQLEKQF